jgi:N-acyl-D-aspartate/D-glutamate deacylase
VLDCLINGGLVVDGTGRPGVVADVGVRDGRIIGLGRQAESARRTIDADGQVVAPGFVDLHTHYDAQVMWDSTVSPSSLHGVTTVIGGNCGFTIAPVSDDSADYVMRMLACVEGIPPSSLEAVLDFRWSTFAEWLARLDGHLATNAGFLAGHSTVRRLVMGKAFQENANREQVRRMAEIVDESVSGGALGFSSSWSESQIDHLGDPVPSRFASAGEIVALASELRSHTGVQLAFNPTTMPVWSDEVTDMMIAMSANARCPLNWNVLSVGGRGNRDTNESLLSVSDRAAKRGGQVVALTAPLPLPLRLNLLSTIIYNSLPTWHRVLALPFAEKLHALSDPGVRQLMALDVEERQQQTRPSSLRFEQMIVDSVASPNLESIEGRVLGDIARERGVSALDAFLDIAVADKLRACFQAPHPGDDDDSWRQRLQYWHDPRVLVGGTDAGAHVDMLSSFAFFTDFIGPIVRERRLLSLEGAVHMVTDAPARLFGLRKRGRIAEGYCADIVIFDPENVRTDKVVLRQDMPNGQSRLFAEAIGIHNVFVNGVGIVEHGTLTGNTPGTTLRSGRDTQSTGPDGCVRTGTTASARSAVRGFGSAHP